MHLCPECKGKGCEKCDFEGLVEQSFSVGKITKKHNLGYEEYQAKKSKSMKFDKKNAIRE